MPYSAGVPDRAAIQTIGAPAHIAKNARCPRIRKAFQLMRSRWMMVLGSLAAVFTLSVVGVASASAAHLIFETEAGHELPLGFTAESSATQTLETTSGVTIRCNSVNVKGEITKVGAGKVLETWHDCEANHSYGTCSNNSEKNAIVTEPLKGTLGWLESEGSSAAGLDLEGESGGELVYAKFTCGSAGSFQITGHLISDIENANFGTFEANYSLLYGQGAGIQDNYGFLGAPKQLYLSIKEAAPEKVGRSEQIKINLESGEPKVKIVESLVTPASPVVKTEAATEVSAAVATLKASVNPEELATKYHFEYGTSKSYGSSTTEANAGEGASTKTEATLVTGLQPNQEYHYRIVASNSDGTSYGGDQTFTTATATLPTFSVEVGHSLPVKFTASFASAPVIVSSGKDSLKCKSVSATGEIVESGEGKAFSQAVTKVVVTYHECTTTYFTGGPCSNNSEKNAIATASLKGKLGFVEPGVSDQVGLELEGEAGGEEPLYAKFTCKVLGTEKSIQINGHLVGEVGPAVGYGTLRSSDTLLYKQSKGTQQALKFPGVTNQLHATPEGETAEKIGIEEESTLTFEGPEVRVEA